jgi:alkylation response protein AidB-like acyl-CoA dehydrogenase
MDFNLTAEQKDIRKAAREFAEGEFDRDLAIELDRTETFPREIIRKGAELGFVGIHYPEELGGQGYGTMEHVLVTEQFCRKDSGIGVCFEIAAFGNELLIEYGSEELKKRWVPRITSGECTSAGGFTEPNHGSDILRLDTTARRDGDEYVINGNKTFISNGSLCDYVILLCMTDPGAEPSHRGISVILVESDRPGYAAESVGAKMGNHMAPTCEIALTELRVPASNLIGEEGRGFYQVLGFFNETRVHVAAQALGLAQGAFDRAVSYIKKREQFGRRIADFQVSQHKVADMATKIETARLLVYRAAWGLDRGKPDPMLSSMAKNVATRAAVEVADEAIQLMGGYGYLTDNEVERIYRDARIMEIWEGTKEIQKNIIAQQVLRKG